MVFDLMAVSSFSISLQIGEEKLNLANIMVKTQCLRGESQIYAGRQAWCINFRIQDP